MGDPLADFLVAGGRLVRCVIYTSCANVVSIGWSSIAWIDSRAAFRVLRSPPCVPEFGVGLVVATAPELGGSAQDGFMLNILASFAEFERELIAGRIAESRARLKARGLRIAGALPFGYDADPRSKQLKPNASESAVVRWMFEQAAAGQTPAEIADGANANGWRTKQTTALRTARTRGGNLWTARQVIATLRNPVYLGLFQEKHDSGLATTRRLSRTSCSLPPQLSSNRVERERQESITK